MAEPLEEHIKSWKKEILTVAETFKSVDNLYYEDALQLVGDQDVVNALHQIILRAQKIIDTKLL